jgi:hypothetical protein
LPKLKLGRVKTVRLCLPAVSHSLYTYLCSVVTTEGACAMASCFSQFNHPLLDGTTDN